jgi:hypothetical protein
LLPPGGETSWEIRDVEEIVTFALFDPQAPGDYGTATLTTDNDGLFHGEIRLDDLQLRVSASPLEDVRDDPESGTQVLFMPGKEVARAAVLAGAAAKHRECDAQWSASGSHPLSGAVFIGDTYLTTYGVPLTGRLYHLRK